MATDRTSVGSIAGRRHVSLPWALAVLAGLIGFEVPAAAWAQGGWFPPWSQPPERKQERPQPLQPQPPQAQPLRPPSQSTGTREAYCAQLEQELARDWMRSQQSTSQLPRIEQEMRNHERTYQQSQAAAERQGCYEYFLFSRSIKPTPACLKLNREIEDSRRALAALQAEKQSLSGSQSQRYRQDELVSALARNGCGKNYQQDAQRRQQQSSPFGFLWQGEDENTNAMRQQGALPFATYRTVCVRLCDGYYFPVSYSTMQSRFVEDAKVCTAKCAAPAELFYYQNPGAEMEQAVSTTGQPYSKIANAFRHRKEYVSGCSCRQADYKPELLQQTQRKAEPTPPLKRPPNEKRSAQNAAEPKDDDLIAQAIERSKQTTPPKEE